MPLISTLAGGSARGYGAFKGGAASIGNFMSVIKSTTETINGIDVLYDTDNMYFAFNNSNATNIGGMKTNAKGDTVNWAVTENLGQYSGYNGVNKSSDGNIVFTGYNNQSGRKTGRAKLNASTGAQIWSYYYDVTGYGNGGTIDGSGNIWSSQQGSSGAGLVKTDTDGANPVFYYINSAVYGTKAQYLPSTGYIYGLITGPPSTYHLTLWALNSSGTQQFQYEFNSNYSTDGNVVADSSGNLYVCSYGADSGTTGGKAFIIKVNTSGSIVAQRTLDSGSTYVDGFTDCVIDSTNGFIYTVGQGNNVGVIAKYNTSLTLQWQRTFTNVSGFGGIQLIDADNILVTGAYTGTGGGVFAARLKTDGSGTGTYAFAGGNVVYAASSLTDAAASYSISSPGRGTSSTTPSRTSTTTINDAVTTTVESLVV
jgi:hypothetical protein